MLSSDTVNMAFKAAFQKEAGEFMTSTVHVQRPTVNLHSEM